MKNSRKKYNYHLLILLSLIFFLFADMPASFANKIEKINVVVMPIEATGLNPAIYQTLTNAFIRRLKKNKKYNYVAPTMDNTETFLVLLTTVTRGGNSYALNTKILNKENGVILAHAENECNNCTIYFLKEKIENLANEIRDVKQNKLKRKELIESEFKRLEEMDQLDNSLFPPEKKIKAWQDYLKKYSKKNPMEKEARLRIELIKIDAAFMETEKSASLTDSLSEQEKLWTEFLSKYEKIGRQPVIQKARNMLESIATAIEKEKRKERRYRRRRRLNR